VHRIKQNPTDKQNALHILRALRSAENASKKKKKKKARKKNKKTEFNNYPSDQPPGRVYLDLHIIIRSARLTAGFIFLPA
jgi:hypothetical protein